jgi:hypothetical protein
MTGYHTRWVRPALEWESCEYSPFGAIGSVRPPRS